MLIPGGIIAWAVNKDRNAPKARKMLLFSIILSVLLMLLLAGVFLLFMRWNASLYGSAY
jgi:flagellar basal body-associated protein FliL